MLSFIAGLGLGCGVGFLGKDLINKLGLKIERIDRNTLKKNEIISLFNDYPVLMNTIKNEFNDPNHKNIREFFVVDHAAIMTSSIPRLRFDLSEDILPALKTLETLDYIEKLPNDSLLYRAHKEFIDFIRV